MSYKLTNDTEVSGILYHIQRHNAVLRYLSEIKIHAGSYNWILRMKGANIRRENS